MMMKPMMNDKEIVERIQMDTIEEIFESYTGEELINIFDNYSGNKDFTFVGRQFLVASNEGVFVVKHNKSGRFFGLKEYNLDSWENGGSTDWEAGSYDIVELEHKEVTRKEYVALGDTLSFEPSWED